VPYNNIMCIVMYCGAVHWWEFAYLFFVPAFQACNELGQTWMESGKLEITFIDSKTFQKLHSLTICLLPTILV